MAAERKYDLDAVVRGCISIGIIAVLYMLARRLSGVLVPFLVSWLVAYMLNPLCEWYQRGWVRLFPKAKGASRGYAVFMTILTAILAVGVFVAMIVPPMVGEVITLKGYVANYVANFNYLDYIPDQLQDSIREWVASIDFNRILASDDVRSGVKNIVPKLWGAVSGGISALSGLAIVFVSILYVVFILLDYEDLSSKWSQLIPVKYRSGAEELMSDLSAGMNSYFRGQAKVASLVGVLFAVGFMIIGLPLGIVMGLLIGVLNMVPYLQTIAVFPCLLLGVIQAAETGRPFWVILLCLLGVFIIVQGIQDMVLTPRIMGKAMGLHPAIILLSLSIWGSLLGVMGLIIALPMTTLIISYYKRFI